MEGISEIFEEQQKPLSAAMESGEYVFPTSVEPDTVGVPAPKLICALANAWKPNAIPRPICVAISPLSRSEEGGPVAGGCATPKG